MYTFEEGNVICLSYGVLSLIPRVGTYITVSTLYSKHSTFKHLSRSKDFFLIRYKLSVNLYTWLKIKHLSAHQN